MTKPAQGRDSGVIEVNADFLITCNGCGKSWTAPYSSFEFDLGEAFNHELNHHKNGHPEGLTVELRDEVHGRWPVND